MEAQTESCSRSLVLALPGPRAQVDGQSVGNYTLGSTWLHAAHILQQVPDPAFARKPPYCRPWCTISVWVLWIRVSMCGLGQAPLGSGIV